MLSPAITAVATGRKTGSTRARAAAGNSTPFSRTSDRSAGPCPGRGSIPVERRNVATTTGSAASTVIVTQVRRRVRSLASSTRSIGAPTGEAQERVLERVAFDDELAHGHPGADERMVQLLGRLAVQR